MPRVAHLVRQNNPGRQWSPTRKLEKKNDSYKANPKTAILKLDRGGYAGQENEYDAQVADLFQINGKLSQFEGENASEFVWTIEFRTDYGKKLREDANLRGGLVTDKNLIATASSGRLDKFTGPDGSIATNQQVVDAFKRALEDIKAQILEIDPKKELRGRFAGVGRTDAFREVNESIDVDTIVSKIIKEIKQ